MALATTYNVVGDREDLTDWLTNLDPVDTPKLSSFPKTKRPTNMYQEWQMDTYAPIAMGGIPEGKDVAAFSNEAVNRARVGNYGQKFRQAWMVSDMQEASDVAGVDSERAYAKVKAAQEVKRSIEACIGSDNEMAQDNGSGTAWKTRGLGKWIQATAQAVNPVPSSYLTPSAAIDTTATGSLSESNFNDVFQAIFQRVGGARSYTLYAGPSLKRAISNFQRATGTSTTSLTYYVSQDATEHQIDLDVTFYQGDFHKVTIIPDLFNGLLDGATLLTTTNQQKARGYVINPDLVGIGYMIGMYSQELQDMGGGPRGFVQAVCTLVCKAPMGLGKFAASS